MRDNAMEYQCKGECACRHVVCWLGCEYILDMPRLFEMPAWNRFISQTAAPGASPCACVHQGRHDPCAPHCAALCCVVLNWDLRNNLSVFCFAACRWHGERGAERWAQRVAHSQLLACWGSEACSTKPLRAAAAAASATAAVKLERLSA